MTTSQICDYLRRVIDDAHVTNLGPCPHSGHVTGCKMALAELVRLQKYVRDQRGDFMTDLSDDIIGYAADHIEGTSKCVDEARLIADLRSISAREPVARLSVVEQLNEELRNENRSLAVRLGKVFDLERKWREAASSADNGAGGLVLRAFSDELIAVIRPQP